MRAKKKKVVLRKKKRAGSLRWLLPLVLILMLAVGGHYFVRSSFFAVKSITVTGCKTLKSAEVVKLSGLQLGTNIFQLDLGAAEGKIRTQVMVETASIQKKFPAALEIAVQERVPRVQVPVQGGILQIDGQGYILAREKITADQTLTVITGIKQPIPAVVGKKLVSPQLQAGLQLVSQMDQQMQAVIGEINVADVQKIKLYTVQGAEIRLGDAQNLKIKYDRFQQILQEAAKDKRLDRIQYIDVSFSDKPVIFYKPE